MDSYCFIEVQTYASVNKMGLELGQYVYDRYDQVVVHENCKYSIKADILQKAEELKEKYPRCRPFKIDWRDYMGRYGFVFDISAKPDNQYNDNYVFILRTSHIRKMNLEVQLNY